MKKIALCLVCLSGFWVLQTVSAQRTFDLDPNGFVPGLAPARITDATRTVFKGVMATRALHGDLCAVAVLPVPADSFDIRLGLFNVAAGDSLDFLVLNSFGTLNGRSLLHLSVSDIVLHPPGTLTTVLWTHS